MFQKIAPPLPLIAQFEVKFEFWKIKATPVFIKKAPPLSQATQFLKVELLS